MRKNTKFFAPLTKKINVWLTEEWHDRITKAADARGMKVSDLARRRLIGVKIPEANIGLIAALNNLRATVWRLIGLIKHSYNLNPIYRVETAVVLREAQKLLAQINTKFDAQFEIYKDELAPSFKKNDSDVHGKTQ